jgi:cell wall-associated NlpC family hydrolase
MTQSLSKQAKSFAPKMIRTLPYRNLRSRLILHQNSPMRIPPKLATAAMLCGLALCVCSAQQAPPQTASVGHARRPTRTLTPDDGLAVISAALDPKVRRYAGHDCSHLVHAIYDRAGFPYEYASSDDLYDGIEKFQRIAHPQTGDLIVWHGHAGIVVRPSRHVFFSFMSAGPGIDDYQSSYWTSRGEPRFYRYIKKGLCPGCAAVNTTFGQAQQDSQDEK